MNEDLIEIFKRVLKETEEAFQGPKPGSAVVYRDEHGLIHMVDSGTGFHAIMGDDYYEALLKYKELPSAKQHEQSKERVYKNIKPYYRKERW